VKRFNKVYLEISNRCNLRCSFCPGTKRAPHTMTRDEFTSLLPKLKEWTDYLYFHIMGEPLCHPQLEEFLQLAGEAGFKVIITTNGTLLKQRKEVLLNSPGLHKVNVSLHAFEANELSVPFSEYLEDCLSFGRDAEGKKLVVYRLWNQGGLDSKNDEILKTIEKYFPKPWHEQRQGPRIGNRIYLEHGDKFEWPDLSAKDGGEKAYCYGLKDQIGVLCDGTVVPCCLDHEGDIKLGNLFKEDMADILASPRTQNIINGFAKGIACEELCRKCGYAHTKFG